MAETSIEWTDEVWNPVTGCSKVSPGCAHCYAETVHERRLDGRHGYPPFMPWTPGNAEHNVTLRPDRLDQPLRWRKPRRVFVNSMSDLFHEEIPDEFIARVFGVMAQCPQHTFQVLTKRPERMRDLLTRWARPVDPSNCCDGCVVCWLDHSAQFPLPNVWLGVSIENRRFVHRADLLRETPAAVRFISAEPLLGPLVAYLRSPTSPCRWWRGNELEETEPGDYGLNLADIDWLIVGGESGPRHRPIRSQWVRDLRDSARRDGVAFFFKQWGGRTPKANGQELDGRTWDEFPLAMEAAHA